MDKLDRELLDMYNSNNKGYKDPYSVRTMVGSEHGYARQSVIDNIINTIKRLRTNKDKIKQKAAYAARWLRGIARSATLNKPERYTKMRQPGNFFEIAKRLRGYYYVNNNIHNPFKPTTPQPPKKFGGGGNIQYTKKNKKKHKTHKHLVRKY